MNAYASRVSTIIPVYNGERYLAEAIASVLAQSCPPTEVIVVDDGSTDGSAGVAKRFGSDVRYSFQPHAGIAAALNRGIERAGGNFLAFLDSDDVWLENKMMLQLAAFNSDAELEIVFGHAVQFISPELDEALKRRLYCPPKPTAAYFKGTMLAKRSVMDRVGMFDSHWRLGDFIDWFSKANEMDVKTLMLPDVVLNRRLHGENMGIREFDSRSDYVHIVKAALDRRRQRNQKPGTAE